MIFYILTDVQEDLTFVEELLQIIDRKEQVLRNNVIPLIRVPWRGGNLGARS